MSAVKAVGYVRVSRVGGREGDSFISPELQREQIAAVAGREVLRVVEVLEELDASGGDAARPLWNEAIRRVEAREVSGIVVWNLSRFSRSVQDALNALARIEAAGGRVYSASEDFGTGPNATMLRNILLSVAQNERDRAKAGWAASRASALERGVWLAGKIPLGYRKDENRRLVPDPDAAPVLQGLFERRAKGWSWARLSAWSGEQGRPLSAKGVEYALTNRTYLGEARSGDLVREDAHEALVSKALFARVGVKGNRYGSRTGRLTHRYLLQGVATCANCGSHLRLTSGRGENVGYYCRNSKCEARAYANAARLDSFVLNILDERINAADPAQWVAKIGDDAAIEDAEHALGEARADLDGFLSDTTLRRTLGADRFNEAAADYVTVVNAAQAALAEAREAHTGSFQLLGHVWLQEWGHAERKEWTEKMCRSVAVTRGRGPMSGRVGVELR